MYYSHNDNAMSSGQQLPGLVSFNMKLNVLPIISILEMKENFILGRFFMLIGGFSYVRK